MRHTLLLACSVVMLGYAAQAHADAYYKLVNRHSGKCLDVEGDRRDDGAPLIQYGCHDGGNQQWSMRPTGDGYFRIIGRNSNKVLDVSGGSAFDGADVNQWDYSGGGNQQWLFTPTPDGYYTIINRHSEKALEIYGVSSADGARAAQWTDWGGYNQQWQLVRVGDDCDRDHCEVCRPGTDEVCVRGRLKYRECLPQGRGGGAADMDRCVLAAELYKPIRRARVEVWSGGRLVNLTESNNEGDFQAVIPAGSDVKVTVVASGPSGQVNWRDNAVTWYWKDLEDRLGVGGTTLIYDWLAERDEARHFNALDVTLRGLEYALAQTGIADELADANFHKVSVIPKWAGPGAATASFGVTSHIWAAWDDDIFDDTTLLHEYGHHLQAMNGTYKAWPASHNGCYATADAGICATRAARYTCGMSDTESDGACWANSPAYAWFEGFPTFYAHAVERWDSRPGASAVLTPISGGPFYKPGFCDCPLVMIAPHFNNTGRPIEPSDIEDYVSNVLLDLWNDPRFGTSLGMPTDQLIFRTWWWDLSGRMPDIFQFVDAWNAQVPGSPVLDSIVRAYGMM